MPIWVLRKWIGANAKRLLLAPLGNEKWFSAFRESLMLQGILAESRTAATRGTAASLSASDK
jgi:hypothetical protein